jgi:hypothetical protein
MSEIKLTADSGGGTTSIKAPSTTTSNADVVLKLPVADGSSGQVIKTDGSGQLSFTSNAGTTINNNADNRVITGSGTANTLEGEVNLKYDGTLKLNGLTNTAGQNSDALTVNRADGLQLFGINWNVDANEVSFSGNTKNYVFKNKSSSAESIRFPATGGITFNGDTAAANALSDYEEGTFSATASAVGYSNVACVDEYYTKIGNIVHVAFRLAVISSLSDGDLTISGLPFSNNGSAGFCAFSWQDGAGFSVGGGRISGTQVVRCNAVSFPNHSSGYVNFYFQGTYRT